MNDKEHSPFAALGSSERKEESAVTTPCMSCGSPQAKEWQTPEGPARLCPTCATLNGIGCP